MTILLMEDDPLLGEILTDYLQEYYTVHRAFDSAEAIALIDSHSFDLFIFDINVPGQSGISLLKELREYHDSTPAIIITAYEDTKYLEDSFDAGAHDYIKKPFLLEEIRLRIERSKRLFRIEQTSTINLTGTIRYNPSEKAILKEGTTIYLKPKEALLLDYFISNQGRIISIDELTHNIWDYENMPMDATLRSQIRNLRDKIGTDIISTHRGEGYCYE